MSRKRVHRADETQAGIVQALRKCGVTVVILSQVGSGVPDLLASLKGRTLLLEVVGVEKLKKYPKTKGLSPEQAKFHRAWQGNPIAIVHTPFEACSAMGVYESR